MRQYIIKYGEAKLGVNVGWVYPKIKSRDLDHVSILMCGISEIWERDVQYIIVA